MRFALIGMAQGFYATTYTRHLARLKDAEIVGVCDLGRTADEVVECAGVTAEAFAAELGCPLVHALDELFALRPDAVIVTSEVSEHAAIAERALQAGCHVFAGKPLSWEPEEVRLLMRAAESAGRVVLPGNPLRYESPLRLIAEQIRGGRIGEPTNVRIFVQHEAMIHQAWERDPQRSGGPLGTFGVYLIDTLRWVTGHELTELYATGGTFVFPQIRSWDTIQAMGVTSGGALVQLNLVSTMTWDEPFVMLDVVGDRGAIRTDHYRYSYVARSPDPALGPIRYDPMGQLEIEHFLDCCLGRSRPAFTMADMLEAARGIRAIERSIRSGSRVRLDDVATEEGRSE